MPRPPRPVPATASWLSTGAAPRRWNPCSTIHYVTELGAAPAYAPDDLQAALVQVSAATGLHFVDDGTTTVWPGTGSEFDSAGHPKPVVIAWATPEQSAHLGTLPGEVAGSELGRAGPGSLVDPVTGHGVYVTGMVVIDSRAAALPPGFGPGALGVVLLYELGHLVGLGHVSDPTQVMNPDLVPSKDGTYGAGDLAGLARLGAASRCLRVPSRRTAVSPF